jgi:hypothetical protein
MIKNIHKINSMKKFPFVIFFGFPSHPQDVQIIGCFIRSSFLFNLIIVDTNAPFCGSTLRAVPLSQFLFGSTGAFVCCNTITEIIYCQEIFFVAEIG